MKLLIYHTTLLTRLRHYSRAPHEREREREREREIRASSTWDNLREKLPEVAWWKLVRFSMAIPKHYFLSWLVFRDALTTKHTLSCWGFNGNLNCLFCDGCFKCRTHIYFSCSFSHKIWRAAMKACGFADPPCCWDDVVDWGISHFHGKSLQACLGRLCFGLIIYHL
jgi:hypothetical protein